MNINLNITNKDVVNFSGSNQELCDMVGKLASPNSPSHFYNFSSKAIRDKAKIAVAEGRGDELFVTSRKNRSPTVSVAKPAPVIMALPAKVSALLPAISLKFNVPDVKQFLFETSKPATSQYEASLATDVLDVLKFFGSDTDSDREMLLAYAGVRTYRDILLSNVKTTLDELSNDLVSLQVSDLERIKIAMIRLSLRLDTITDNYGNLLV